MAIGGNIESQAVSFHPSSKMLARPSELVDPPGGPRIWDHPDALGGLCTSASISLKCDHRLGANNQTNSQKTPKESKSQQKPAGGVAIAANFETMEDSSCPRVVVTTTNTDTKKETRTN